ncbi:MAG: Nickel uptake substrate-specific transmembrane region [Smithella sp. PtaU1.Bin162]|nr:MAG: Nickel uptake substrate-specific transmembrane region [Smithella sp. PtaU1.Bin162]
MQKQLKQAYVIIISFIIFLGIMILPSYAGTASYTYDNGNRLICVDYDEGSKIEYIYDESGNRTVKNIIAVDTIPPVTTATPAGGTYNTAQTVTLTCNDGTGSGCNKIYYTTNGTTPTTSSPIYSAPIAIAVTTTLKYFAQDLAGNTENVQSQTYTITAGNSLQVALLKDEQNILAGVHLYLFSGAGSYLGQSKTTDTEGKAIFDVTPGTYKVRADYLGYQFWSNSTEVVTTANVDMMIPHHDVTITINSIYQGSSVPLADINVYLFTPAGSYLGLTQKTGINGQVAFALPDKDYKVRADYLAQQYLSSVFNSQNTAINIPLGDAEITVTQGSQNLNAVNVYVFTSGGSYLGLHDATDVSGKVTFRLPAGNYKFRADYLGSQYWSTEEIITADQLKPININTGGGLFTLTVFKGASAPLTGANCYVFTEAGSYIGLSGTTNSNGQTTFNLSNGSFKFRIDYLGYQHWTEVAAVPTITSLTKTILHQNATLTVQGSVAGNLELKHGIPVYLFTPAGSYLASSKTTDVNGQATFNLPERAYKVRADYLSRQFWSEEFTWVDKTIVIPEGIARVHVTMAGQDLQNVPVYVFTATGSYLNITGNTDASGNRDFRLPSGDYKFRADYQGNQYWATASISPDVINMVELSTGGSQFTLTVLKDVSDPLTGVNCYVFTEAGVYLGITGATDVSGQKTFNLADGNYKFRIDYLGYQFWTDVFTVPASLSGSLTIPHQDITITVEGIYPETQYLAGVNVYLFTTAGSYLGKTQATSSSGQVAFNLPDKSYKVRADYLGNQFWSNEFQSTNATVSIQRGIAQAIAKKTGNPMAGLKVYLFSAAGSYLGINATTNTEGKSEFILPNRSYKFRVDEGSTQHWSPVTTITEVQINAVEVNWD